MGSGDPQALRESRGRPTAPPRTRGGPRHTPGGSGPRWLWGASRGGPNLGTEAAGGPRSPSSARPALCEAAPARGSCSGLAGLPHASCTGPKSFSRGESGPKESGKEKRQSQLRVRVTPTRLGNSPHPQSPARGPLGANTGAQGGAPPRGAAGKRKPRSGWAGALGAGRGDPTRGCGVPPAHLPAAPRPWIGNVTQDLVLSVRGSPGLGAGAVGGVLELVPAGGFWAPRGARCGSQALTRPAPEDLRACPRTAGVRVDRECGRWPPPTPLEQPRPHLAHLPPGQTFALASTGSPRALGVAPLPSSPPPPRAARFGPRRTW